MTKASVPIVLDKKRRLRFTYNAFAQIDQELGEDPMASGFWEKMTPRKLRVLLWAGLVWESPALTVQQAGELMTAVKAGELVKPEYFDRMQAALGVTAPGNASAGAN